MALPAIAAVRQWFADAHLAVAARASVAPLLSMADGVDEVITLAGRGDWRDAEGRRADARQLAVGPLRPRAAAAQLVSCRLARATGRRAGALGVSRRPARRCSSRAAWPGRAGRVTQAGYYLALVRALGGPDAPLTAALQVTGAQREAAAALLRASGWTGRPAGGLCARRRVRPRQALAAGPRRPGRARRLPPTWARRRCWSARGATSTRSPRCSGATASAGRGGGRRQSTLAAAPIC